MQRSWGRALLLAGGVSLLSVAAAHASTIDGTPVTLQGADNFFSTIWHYITGAGGKLFGAGTAGKGFVTMGDRNPDGSPYMKILGGTGLAFGPNIIGTAFDSAAGATGLSGSAAGLWALARDGFLGWRLVQDPVFYALLLLSFYAVYLMTRQGSRVAA
jgi:hypothetical protein